MAEPKAPLRSNPSSKPVKSALKKPAVKHVRTSSDDSTRTSRVYFEQSLKAKKEMAACFLQYCAMCEKQIMTPQNDILYCSQACRRKDASKPLSVASISTPSSPTHPPSYRPNLVSRHSCCSSESNFGVLSIPHDLYHHKPDLDPTEWKPKPSARRTDSEAFRYLSQFHRSTAKDEYDGDDDMKTYRAPYSPGFVGSVPATPSLANTPTTFSSWNESMSYEFQTRPLQPRHNPLYSSNAAAMKSIDLVTPHIVPIINGAGEQSVWEKKVVFRTPPRAQEGLSVLFSDMSMK